MHLECASATGHSCRDVAPRCGAVALQQILLVRILLCLKFLKELVPCDNQVLLELLRETHFGLLLSRNDFLLLGWVETVNILIYLFVVQVIF